MGVEKKKGADVVKNSALIFTKEQILASKKYSDRRDLLNALLQDSKSYSLDKVETLIDKFMKRKVK